MILKSRQLMESVFQPFFSEFIFIFSQFGSIPDQFQMGRR